MGLTRGSVFTTFASLADILRRSLELRLKKNWGFLAKKKKQGRKLLEAVNASAFASRLLRLRHARHHT